MQGDIGGLEREGVRHVELLPHHHAPRGVLGAEHAVRARGRREVLRRLAEQPREDPLLEARNIGVMTRSHTLASKP